MNGTTAYLLLAIVIIGIIAIIIVKLYYKDGHDKNIESISELKQEIFGKGKKRKTNDPNSAFIAKHQSLSKQNTPKSQLSQSAYSLDKTESTASISDITVTADNGVLTVENVMLNNDYVETIEPIHEEIENESTGTVALVKEDDAPVKEEIPEVTIPKDVESFKDDSVTTAEKENTSKYKDLFTIDELINESKRKNNELEKKNKGEDLEESEIKTAISKSKDITNAINQTKEKTIHKLDEELSPVERINTAKKLLDKTSSKVQTESDLISKAKKEAEVSAEKTEPVNEEVEISTEEIKKPKLREEEPQEDITEDEVSIYKLNDDEDKYPEEYLDLDYRKDLEKIKSVIKKSKIIKNVKNKVTPEMEYNNLESNEEFIRNVNTHEPIYPETDYVEPIIPNHEVSRSSEEHTRKAYNMAKNTNSEVKTESTLRVPESQQSISFILNNEKTTLKKKDEIIYFVGDDTYSSKVFDIRGEDIYVRYRGKNKIIKTSDIKKIY